MKSKKQFRIRQNVGKAKYLVSYHDGVKKHKDGSDFFDIAIFKNKPMLHKFTSKLVNDGYSLT